MCKNISNTHEYYKKALLKISEDNILKMRYYIHYFENSKETAMVPERAS